MKTLKWSTAIILFCVMLLMVSPTAVFGAGDTPYAEYVQTYQDVPYPTQGLVIAGSSFTSGDGVLAVDEGIQGAVDTGEIGYVEWTFDVEEAGLYNISVEYWPIPGRRGTILREIWINGERPFFEAQFLNFSRVWGDEAEPRRDNQGNELRARQIEKPRVERTIVQDSLGMFAEPLKFYFHQGLNTLRLIAHSEPMRIIKIELVPVSESPSYEQAVRDWTQRGISQARDFHLKVQGEDAAYRSSPTLFPVYDTADPAVEPYHPYLIRLNAIGGQRWAQPGDWIAWEIEVPEDGLYTITFQYKQNQRRGSYSNRRLWINGEVPFQEAQAIRFPFTPRYKTMPFAPEDGGAPYLVYLRRGINEIRLEATLGDLADIIRTTQESLYELNTIYRRIVMITSANPDPIRDYQLEDRIPQLLRRLEQQSEILAGVAAQLESYTGQKGEYVAVLNDLARQMKSMAQRPETIPRRLGEYRDLTGALGTWIVQAREQPLQIDYLIVASPDAPIARNESGMLALIGHELRSFWASFTHRYDLVGDVHEVDEDSDVVPLKVWFSSGRDQAHILKEMIEDSFTPMTGIPVNLELVNREVLLPAVLAGRGPDVALNVHPSQPIDFALRKGLINLADMPGFQDTAEQFMPSALVPYMFRDQVVALPEQQPFPMLFYRTDVLAELGLELPDTWDDVMVLIPELQKAHMEFGLPFSTRAVAGVGGIGEMTAGGSIANHAGVTTFLTFLYQLGAELYIEDGVRTNLQSEEAVDAFTRWTEMYELYNLPVDYDAANRFRTGQMPLLIADYTFYNLLSVFAPEIRGQWDFTLIPGTVRADGTIDRSVPSALSGTAAMILRDAHDPLAAWEFLKWWTSPEAQARFGRELESLLGAAARYPTANVEAMRQLPWSVEQIDLLTEQWAHVKGVPEVPGGYMMGRHLDNAFRRVVFDHMPAREVLLDYDLVINDEISVKRAEFGLPTTLEDLPPELRRLYWVKP